MATVNESKIMEKVIGKENMELYMFPETSLRYISDLNLGKYLRCEKYFSGEGKNSEIEYGMHSAYKSTVYTTAKNRMHSSMMKIYRYIMGIPSNIDDYLNGPGKKKKYMDGGQDMKFAVWSLMHYVLMPDAFMLKNLPLFMPESKKGISAWNGYVKSVNDIPESIKNRFLIDSMGKCKIEQDLHKWSDETEYTVYGYNPEKGLFGKITVDMITNDEEDHIANEHPVEDSKGKVDNISRKIIIEKIKSGIKDEEIDLNEINIESIHNYINIAMMMAGIDYTNKMSSVINKIMEFLPEDVKEEIRNYEKEAGYNLAEILYKCDIITVKDFVDFVDEIIGFINPSQIVLLDDPDPVVNEHPVEDPPVVGDVVKDDIVDIKSTELKETAPTKEEDTKQQPEEKIDLSAPAKINFKFMPAVTFEPPVKDEEQKNLSFDFEKMKQSFVQTPVFSQTQLDDIYKESNKSWENRFPKLEKFTTIVHKNDLYVNYSIMEVFNTYDVFRADLISKTGVIVKSLLIDYYTIYGDGIRVGTMNDQYGDVYNELWINIYDANYVSKLINGTLTEEDTIALSEKYPPYLRDIVRMVDITELPKDIPNTKWKSFMNKIGKVIMNLPNDARFRLVNYSDTNKWGLVCAPNVNISFVSKNDPRLRSTGFTNIQSHGLYIDYDEAKYKANNNYIVGNLDGSPLGFDPYGFKK